ncbi:MAG TPA: histidine kinase [Cyclobacteriaceae bacterium]|jgi:sensor histidine kinase YesM|nr:histidine kinase [Cyclobacteriaceae bacterium]
MNKDHPIYHNGNVLSILFQGGMVVLIAHVQVYIHNVYLYKKYFSKNNLKYFIGTVLLFISYFLINYFTPFRFVQINEPVTIGISIFFIYLVGLGFYYTHKNILERNLLFKTELIERDEEIRYLKAQLNPHFLFNALNNLYGTALTDPAETPDKILELSDLLRYQIESSKKERVSLDDEIQFIRKYLSYEKNRTPKLKIDFTTAVSSKQVSLSPMLFMPFIDNAIKYSASTDEPFFSLFIKADKKKLTFIMKNNFSKDGRKVSGTNTGISNTKKRLALTYKNRHELSINDDNEVYSVALTIKL